MTGDYERGLLAVQRVADPHPRQSEESIKIWFKFVPRIEWLPFDTEGMWAIARGADTAEVDNVPFLQAGIAVGDVVQYVVDDRDRRWSVRRIAESGNCTVRILPDPSGPFGKSGPAVIDRFRPFGIDGEVFSNELPLVALNVSAEADFSAIKSLLGSGEEAGWWFVDVGCGTQRWWDA